MGWGVYRSAVEGGQERLKNGRKAALFEGKSDQKQRFWGEKVRFLRTSVYYLVPSMFF